MAVQDIVVRDFWWKFLAFVLATLIWANFGGKLDDRLELDESGVHLTEIGGGETNVMVNLPERRPIMVLRGGDVTGVFRVEPAEVRVVVKGEAGRLKTLDTKLILAFVDVTDMNEKASGTAPARPVSRLVQVHTPPGVELVSVEPRSVVVERVPSAPPAATDSIKK